MLITFYPFWIDIKNLKERMCLLGDLCQMWEIYTVKVRIVH